MSMTAGHAQRIRAAAFPAAAGVFAALGVAHAWASVELLALRSLLGEIVCMVCREEVQVLGYPFTWPAAPIVAVLCFTLAAAAALTAWRVRTTRRHVLGTRPEGVAPQRPS